MLTPGLDRVRLVQPHRLRDRLPQPLDVGLAEHLPGLSLGGERGDRPVDLLLVLRAQLPVLGLHCPGLPDPCLVEVGQELGLGIAREHDQRAAVCEGLGPCHEPRCRRGQVLVCGMLDELPPEVVVDVTDVDEARACLIAGAPERANERCVLDERLDVDRLPRLDIGADPDDQLGIGVEPLGHGRGEGIGGITCRVGRRSTPSPARRAS